MQHNIDKVLENIRNNINLLNINDIIKKIPENNEITLLGESTHGTSEFYDIRSSITKSLIENREYTILLIEAEWPDIYRVNTYIQGKR